MVAVAIGGSAIIGGISSAVGASSAAGAAKSAAKANNALQEKIFDENKATLAPFVGQGNLATPAINALLGLGGGTAADQQAQYNQAFSNFQNSTGYKFALDQGNKQVQAALGSKGLLDSGAAQKSLTNYGQQAALGSYGQYYGALTGQQGVGLTAASAQAGVGQNFANAVSSNNNNSAAAQGNAALAGSAGINNALGGALSAYTFSQGLGSSYGGSGASNAVLGVGGDQLLLGGG